MARVNQSAGDTQSAVPLRPESIEGGLKRPARRRVKRPLPCISRFVGSRQPQQIFGRSLDDQPAFGVVFDQYRNPPQLKIEWHFIELLPTVHIDRMRRQNRLVERT